MRTRESNLWKWLRRGIPPSAHVQRVENAVESGTPDVEGCIPTEYSYEAPVQFWLELKSVSRPDDEMIDCELSPVQARWIKRRTHVGGDVYILVQVGVGRSARRYLVPGMYAYELLGRIPEGRLAKIALSMCDTPEEVFEAI